jgi:ubiquinone/menaquinone biosynthesis C-methylase UbiE
MLLARRGLTGHRAADKVVNASTLQIREEFDRIALLTERHGGASDVYRYYLIRQLPPHYENALEIGCGTGEFTRLLAARARSVVALDLSSQMIRLAGSRSADYPNIEYVVGDVMRLALPAGRFDCIVSIATLHHLPLEEALLKMKDALKPNGVLIIHDLVADVGLVESLRSALAYPVSVARRFWKTGRMRAPREVREAWAEHGKGEVYLTPDEVRGMCERYLPDARIKRHLLWRYTVVWYKRGAV